MTIRLRDDELVEWAGAGMTYSDIACRTRVSIKRVEQAFKWLKQKPEHDLVPWPEDGRATLPVSKSGRETQVWAKAQIVQTSRMCRSQKLPFNIVVPDVLPVPDTCPALGLPLCIGRGGAAPVVDIVDISKGAVRGNVVVVSALARRIRGGVAPAQLVRLVKFYNMEHGEPVSAAEELLPGE